MGLINSESPSRINVVIIDIILLLHVVPVCILKSLDH